MIEADEANAFDCRKDCDTVEGVRVKQSTAVLAAIVKRCTVCCLSKLHATRLLCVLYTPLWTTV